MSADDTDAKAALGKALDEIALLSAEVDKLRDERDAARDSAVAASEAAALAKACAEQDAHELEEAIVDRDRTRDALERLRHGIEHRQAYHAGVGDTPDTAHDLEVEIGRLTYRQPSPAQISDMADVGEAVRELCSVIVRRVPRGRERALALTALQDVRLRSNTGIMLDAPAPKAKPASS